MNLFKINEKICISATRPDSSCGDVLRSLDVELVIYLNNECVLKADMFLKQKIKVKHIGVRNVNRVNVIATMGIVARNIDKCESKVLLVCSGDCERSVAAAMYYIMLKNKVDARTALDEIQASNKHLSPNQAHMDQIIAEFNKDKRRPESTARRERRRLSMITPDMWITDFETSTDASQLAQLGITRVLNITPESKPAHVCDAYKALHIIEHRYSIQDLPSSDIISVLQNVLARLQDGDKILVHCHAGVSRSVSVVIGILIHRTNMSYDEAYQLVQSNRSVAKPNVGFEAQLRQWAAKLGEARQQTTCDLAAVSPS